MKESIKNIAAWIALMIGVSYMLFPVDFVPDALPFIGVMDDLVAITVTLIPAWEQVKKQFKAKEVA